METSILLNSMHRRMIKNFLDVLILAELRKGPLSGYDIIAFIYNKFRVLVSSGTVYSRLYLLEREGSIEGSWNQRKRVYQLTEKGEETIETVIDANDELRYLLSTLLKMSK